MSDRREVVDRGNLSTNSCGDQSVRSVADRAPISRTFGGMIKATLQGRTVMRIEQKNGSLFLEGNETPYDLRELKEGSYHILLNGVSYSLDVISSDATAKRHVFRLNGKKVTVQLEDRYDALLKELGMDSASTKKTDHLKAPMPGLVVDIPVKEGQQINKGDTLVILEAMKMENALKAVADAMVKKINVIKGQAVEKNVVLVELA